MAAESPEPEVVLPELDVDTQAVVVFWIDGGDMPDVTMHNTSPYEAIGFLRVALKKLEADWALPLAEEDDDEPD